MGTSHHVLQFPATFDGFKDAAGSLRMLLDRQELDGDLRFNVELAFEEIVANIIRHGFPRSDVTVAIAFEDDQTVLTFEDDGVPFDPRQQQASRPPASIDDAPVGGLGLLLVRKISGRIEYERTSHDRNRLTLAIPARSRAASSG